MQKKSVYSIVLSDRVVEQVDALAYENGMSRSAMINHILAEQLSLTTPEQQMRSIAITATNDAPRLAALIDRLGFSSGGSRHALCGARLAQFPGGPLPALNLVRCA